MGLYFSTHATEGITPPLRQLFESADMVLIEQDYKEDDDRNLNLLNELSRGNLLIDDVLKVTSGPSGQIHPDFTNGLLLMIFRSGKTILLENSPYSFYEANVQYALARQEFRNMPLRKACQLLAENLAKRATNYKKRDEVLAQQLADIVSQNPSSNILVIRGHGHRPSLEHALGALNVSFTSVTPHEQISILFIDELIQKIMAGGRPTRRELVRSLVEQVWTRTTPFRANHVGIRSLRESMDSMSELQCEKYLKKQVNLT